MKQEELKSILKYDKDTGNFINRYSRRKAREGDIAGSIDNGYIRILIKGKKYYAHRLVFLYLYGYMPSKHIDHINHNRADNRIVNLREVTHQENLKNSRIPKDNRSGVVGVAWSNKHRKWQASIGVDNEQINLGFFYKFHEAVNARKNTEALYGFHKNHGKDK